MDIDTLIDHLEIDGPALADAGARAGLDAAVPACPGWTIRDLVTHTGGVHRWAADVVAIARDTTDTAAGDAVGHGPADDELLAWFMSGHAWLVAALRCAPPDLGCATFLPSESPLTFWARRQAHETAIHRADAESSAGPVTAFDAEFAQDGMAELLHGFAVRRSNATAEPGTVALRAVDGPAWLVTFGGERIVAAPEVNSRADAVVAGTSSDLYLWLWHRPSAAAVRGDARVAALWDGVRVTWS